VGTFAQNEEETFKECQNEGQSPGSGTLPDLVPTSAEGVVNPVYIQMARGGANGWAEPWKTWHLENVPRPKALGVPVVVWQGSADSTVLPSETRKYVAELRTGGLVVELREVAGATHNDTVMGPVTLPQAGGEDFVTWMRARFAD
jgi:pimeloyl-ACP methyl ester carboxylesterase